MTISLLKDSAKNEAHEGNLIELLVQKDIDSVNKLIYHEEYLESKKKAFDILEALSSLNIDIADTKKQLVHDFLVLEDICRSIQNQDNIDLTKIKTKLYLLDIRKVIYKPNKNGRYTLYMTDKNWIPMQSLVANDNKAYRCYWISGDSIDAIIDSLYE